MTEMLILMIVWQTGLNDFSNDTFSISAQYLVSLIQGRGLQIKQYFKVSHYDSGVVHYVVVLAGGQYVCDCMMGINLGIPCRHFFAVLYMGTGISFHIGLFNPRQVKSVIHYVSCHLPIVYIRWLINPQLDLTSIPPIVLGRGASSSPLPATALVPLTFLLFLDNPSRTPPPVTRTLPPQVIHHQAFAKLKIALCHVHPEQDLLEVESGIQEIM